MTVCVLAAESVTVNVALTVPALPSTTLASLTVNEGSAVVNDDVTSAARAVAGQVFHAAGSSPDHNRVGPGVRQRATRRQRGRLIGRVVRNTGRYDGALPSIKSTVLPLTVDAVNASLKVTVTVALVATFVDPLAGLKAVTVGGVVSGAPFTGVFISA